MTLTGRGSVACLAKATLQKLAELEFGLKPL